MNDEKKLKALSAKLAKSPQTKAGLNQFLRMLIKLTIETALNAELTDDYPKKWSMPIRNWQWAVLSSSSVTA